MRADYRAVGVICGVLLALITGCLDAGKPRHACSVRPSSHPYVADIPLPEGFALADKSSEDWAAGPIRYLRHRYRGRGDRDAVRRFYREEMPLVRWTPASEGSIDGHCTMSFERDSEHCRVTIESDPGLLGPVVWVTVLITPRTP